MLTLEKSDWPELFTVRAFIIRSVTIPEVVGMLTDIVGAIRLKNGTTPHEIILDCAAMDLEAVASVVGHYAESGRLWVYAFQKGAAT